MGESSSNKQIGYLLRSYPRLSQTFILNEILALEQIGVSIQIFALTNPHEKTVQMQVNQVHAPVHYLDGALQPRALGSALHKNFEVARRYFKGYCRSLFYIVANTEIDRGYTASNRWQCFLQAIHFIYQQDLEQQNAGRRINHQNPEAF